MTNLDETHVSFIEKARFDGNERQWGSNGGYQWLTDITSVKNGKEKRNAVYSSPKGVWEVGNRGVTESENRKIQDFHYNVMGRLIGFRMRDWADYKDDGSGVCVRQDSTLTYQMYKKREIANANVYRLQKIKKPIGKTFLSDPDLGNTIKFFWNDVEVVQSTSSPLSINLDDTTGEFIFNPAALICNVNNGVFTSTTDHNLKINDGIRFERNSEVIYTYVTRVVNSKVFTTAYTTMFIQNNLTVNPFPTDQSNFRWTGLFDKPVRFDTDNISPTIQIFKENENDEPTIALQLPSIQIVEIV